MDALIDASPHPPVEGGPAAERRVRAFRAMDAFAIETYQAFRGAPVADSDSLAREIRKAVSRVGGALIAACSTTAGSETERRGLESVRSALFEARYQLYLARRLGFIELRPYRTVSLRHDAVLKEVAALLATSASRRPP